MGNIGLLMAASFVAWGLQLIVVYIGLYALLTKSNPFTYLKHIAPAQLFAFSSASSAATIASIGTAPVPSASLVLIMAAYNTVFDGTGEPNGFGYIFAIDWFMDRIRTTCNVTGDCIVAGIVAHRCPLEEDTTDDSKEGKALSEESEEEESV